MNRRINAAPAALSVLFYIIAVILIGPALAAQEGPSQTDALANYRAGRALESQGRMREAGPYYTAAVRISTEAIERKTATRDSYAALVWSLLRQEKYRDAITRGEQGISLWADEYRLVEALGEAYFYVDDYRTSLRYLQRYTGALPQGEQAASAYFFMGDIYRLERKFLLADVAYSAALRLSPGVALWWYRLGLAREGAGDWSRAIQAFERALGINPAFREAGEGLARARKQAQA